MHKHAYDVDVDEAEDMLGCSHSQAYEWLRATQKDPDDNDFWAKQASGGEHIDHVRPVKSFRQAAAETGQGLASESNKALRYQCGAFWNLQMLPAKMNLSKSAKYDTYLEALWNERRKNCEGQPFAVALRWLKEQPDEKRYHLMPAT